MPLTKVILLACGSYNPPTNMHLRMFEVAKDHLHRLGNHLVIGGLVSPVHDGYGKAELISSTHRLEMLKLALSDSEWIKVSDWETRQESWTRTRSTLQYHQNQINSYLNLNNVNDNELTWLPDNVRNGSGFVQLKLLCGSDLLESFATPGLWSEDDIEAIVGNFGLIVVTRDNSNPLKFIYNSDLLTKYMANIVIVTEWIRNEVSSTKIRRALKRSESVRYLIPDRVLNYIYKHGLYGSSNKSKYLQPLHPTFNTPFLTPSPTDMSMDSPSPLSNRCMNLCNNNLFANAESIDVPDSINKTNQLNMLKHPGQAVKIITETSGHHKLVKGDSKKEVCKNKEAGKSLKSSKSCTEFAKVEKKLPISKSNESLECKSCDENLIKFIFTKHGIQVISDVETIV